ncbi:hypothetical protein PLESTF_000485900 [Pleodorina starrii]|nr:hypothetical protein PLESTF_000485900 [Pleodorina starrii]
MINLDWSGVNMKAAARFDAHRGCAKLATTTGLCSHCPSPVTTSGRLRVSCRAGASRARAVPAPYSGHPTANTWGPLPPQQGAGPRRAVAPPQTVNHSCVVEPRPAPGGYSGAHGRRLAAAVGAAPAAAAAAAGPVRQADASGAKGADGDSSAAGGKDDWRHEVITALARAEGFAELTIRAKVASAQPWHTITVRPVSLRGARHLQVTTFTARQSTSVNQPVGPPEAAEAVEAVAAVVRPLLGMGGVGSVTLRTAGQDLAVQITKRGKGIVHRSSPQNRPALVSSDPGSALSHDRSKHTPIPADQPHPFLHKIGFQTADGRIKANMQDKFSQVNEFLKLLSHTGLIRELLTTTTAGSRKQQRGQEGQSQPGPPPARAPLHILDCGCGSSHLSFGTYHYLNHVLGLPASLAGVDVNGALMQRSNDNAAQLGMEGVSFHTAPIGEYSPPVRPDIVLALHACDTATDDALALAVKQGSPLVMAVPCCHAHLHKQLSGRPPSCRPPWTPLLRHGILRQRQLDLLTDTLRAQLLRVAGYQTDVVEFVSTEHTPRNLLIRAVRQQPQQQGEAQRGGQPDRAAASGGDGAAGAGSPPLPPPPSWGRQQLAAAREYVELRDYWGVTPRLEVLLREELGSLLVAAEAEAAAAEQQLTDETGTGTGEVEE